jgi:hypothetical protein
MKKISEITKRDIQDYIIINKVNWAGRLEESEFLSRLYNLKNIRSFDGRFNDFEGDIWQHRVNNYDWDDDWIFSDTRINLNNCDDAEYLRFLCEMLHPVVRSDYEEVNQLLQAFNSLLKNDGYVIVEKARISGHPIYAAKLSTDSISILRKNEIVNKLSSEYVMQQITSMETSIESSPHIAIGLAKELIETVLKSILRENNGTVNDELNIQQLLKETSKILNLVPKEVSDEKRGAEKIRQILGNLGNIVSGIAELRNDYGSGHGKDDSFRGLQGRHAKLAVGSASTLAIFLLETWEMMKSKASNSKKSV